jgi:hypothetical protein
MQLIQFFLKWLPTVFENRKIYDLGLSSETNMKFLVREK